MFKNISSILVLLCISTWMNAQYCFPTYSIACTSSDYIENFSTTGGVTNISNLMSGCNGGLPNNYIQVNQTVAQIQGLSFNFSVQAGAAFGQGHRIWIDWNQDLDFADPGEDVYVSPSSGTQAYTGTITVPVTAVPGITRMRVLCRFATVPGITDYCGTNFSFGECEDYYMNVIPSTPCSGQPTAGSVTPSSMTLCAGQTANLSLIGAVYQGNMTYQWQQSTNGGATWVNAVGGIGSNSPGFQTPSLNATIMYRMYMVCNNSNLADTTGPMTITVSGPSYATLPYVQDFETWTNFCGSQDVPNDYHWSNNPNTGNNSWRRNDEGNTANWLSNTFGMYYPSASSNTYSARFHSYYTNLTGDLDLFIDCSQQLGTKTMFFDYINDNSAGWGFDYLEVLLSTNGGISFTTLGTFNSSTTWQNFSLPIVSNDPNTVVRFRGHGDFQFDTDFGIDNINVLAPCTGTPNAGSIANILPCANTPFNLTLTGNTLAGGLNYIWQSAPTATGPWTALGVSVGPSYNTQIGTPTYFRCIVDCPSSGFSDTTAALYVDLASFYYCYCISQALPPSFYFQNIGNVTIFDAQNSVLLNNGNAAPLLNNASPIYTYQTFANTVAPVNIYRDSTYSLFQTSIAQSSFFYNGYTTVYIDYNRDGVFDPTNEMILGGVVNPPTQQMSGNFTVPANAQYGLTGMRLVYQIFGSSTSNNPCGTYSYGETEDYLVNIALPPCNTPPDAGIALISDTITCPGYSVFLIDTTHDVTYQNLSFNWQFSTNGITYADIPGATADTLTFTVNTNTWFRFRTTCNGTSDGYSNVVNVVMSPPFACYGFSQAIGGNNDSSDVGAFIIGDISNNNNIYAFITGGPHLLNPASVKKRTDYTAAGTMELITDSLYKISIYHIMKSSNHADAQVSVFIDYNNNQQYDSPNERVFTGVANVNNFYLNGSFQTPISPALNVATGLRVVLNNDLSPNGASDNGVGTFVSGETEDYLVRFKLKQLVSTDLEEVQILDQIGVYPNPTNGKVFVGFYLHENLNVQLTILSITGAVLESRTINGLKGQAVEEFNMGSFAKGTYLIRLQTEKGSYVRRIVVE